VKDSVHVAGIKYSKNRAEKAAVNMEKCTLSGLLPLLASREPISPSRMTVKANSRARRPSPMMRGIVMWWWFVVRDMRGWEDEELRTRYVLVVKRKAEVCRAAQEYMSEEWRSKGEVIRTFFPSALFCDDEMTMVTSSRSVRQAALVAYLSSYTECDW
jgi:hypothetical protein